MAGYKGSNNTGGDYDNKSALSLEFELDKAFGGPQTPPLTWYNVFTDSLNPSDRARLVEIVVCDRTTSSEDFDKLQKNGHRRIFAKALQEIEQQKWYQSPIRCGDPDLQQKATNRKRVQAEEKGRARKLLGAQDDKPASRLAFVVATFPFSLVSSEKRRLRPRALKIAFLEPLNGFEPNDFIGFTDQLGELHLKLPLLVDYSPDCSWEQRAGLVRVFF